MTREQRFYLITEGKIEADNDKEYIAAWNGAKQLIRIEARSKQSKNRLLILIYLLFLKILRPKRLTQKNRSRKVVNVRGQT